MCQDSVKIQEQDLDNESVQNVLKQPLILRKVLESLDFVSLLECRVVCKSWGKEATLVLGKKCKITFKSAESIDEFLALPARSEGLFTHVAFNFDVKTESSSAASFLKTYGDQLCSVDTPRGPIAEWAQEFAVTPKSTCVTDHDQPAVLDENANFVQQHDESNLHEVVIHDEEVEEEHHFKAPHVEPSRKPNNKSVHFSLVENPEYVPIPYNDEGYDSFTDFYPYYLGEHSNEKGRRLHILGITNSIILVVIGAFTLTPLLFAVAVVQAYALAIGAHFYFDKHVPRPTIRNPLYMVMGNLKMWWEVASGQRAL